MNTYFAIIATVVAIRIAAAIIGPRRRRNHAPYFRIRRRRPPLPFYIVVDGERFRPTKCVHMPISEN